jgi:hypothetical protein
MSAFKEHCSLGFWGEEISAVLRNANVLQPGAMGSLGRLTRIEDLPPNKQMLSLLRQAASFVDSGQYTSPIAARSRSDQPESSNPGCAHAASSPA